MPMAHHLIHLSRSGSRRKPEALDDSPDFLSSTNHNTDHHRFSFGSDHDYLFPILVQNLAGRPLSLDPDQPHIIISSKQQQLPVQHSSKNSFSEALKECQDRRSISDERQRPDLIESTTAISPPFLLGGNLKAMKTKPSSSLVVNTSSSSRTRTGAAAANLSSPGTPSYSYHKGWSSERVPLTVNSTRRHVHALPFNIGKALPSKWEDAEKWIFSPAVGDNAGRYSVPPSHHRRPKSKSGPLGPPAYLSASASPLNACYDSGRVGWVFHGSSPFLSGVLVADRTSCGSGSSSGGRGGACGCVSGGRSSSANPETYIIRSASVHGWSDAMIESSASLPSSQDEKSNGIREAGTVISPTVLRKDVATQMSPDGSPRSSQKERLSFSPSPPSARPIEDLERHFSKLEVRDVQVDDRVTVTRWSKKHIARGSDRHSTNITEWRKKTVESKASSSLWEVAEAEKSISKFRRDEAKITAWENLQKAKAEASIRKLEMKLEKKRSSSMDKILNKLRSAQRKAQELRSAVTANQALQVTSTSKRSSYFRRSGQSSPLSSCFTCHAF